ncbi:MAG: alpha/beta hydrolase [Promethearchaeota archaeon]
MEIQLLLPRSVGGILHAVHFLCQEESSFKSEKKPPFVIICHGFTGDKYEIGRFPATAKALNEVGFDALIFDFSGSGENERETLTLSKQVRDLEDVYAWAKNQGYSWIAVIGLSFGGLTILVANLPGIRTLIFWAPAFYMRKFFTSSTEENLKRKPFTIQSSGDYDPITIDITFVESLAGYDVNSYLQKLETPTLIILGKKDGTIGPRDIRKGFKLLPQDEHHKLIEIENATHDFEDEHLTLFIEASIKWLKKYL